MSFDNKDKSVNTKNPRYSKLTIGVCPDQWGVWFPDDPKQIDPDVAMSEITPAQIRAARAMAELSAEEVARRRDLEITVLDEVDLADGGYGGLEASTVINLAEGEPEVIRVGCGDPTPFQEHEA